MARCLVQASSPLPLPPPPLFALHSLLPPSSPLAPDDRDGQLSPSSVSFNDSFAASMSLTTTDPPAPTIDLPPAQDDAPRLVLSPSPSIDAMDFSPAAPTSPPVPRAHHSDSLVLTLRAPAQPALERTHSDSAASRLAAPPPPQFPFLEKLLREREAAKPQPLPATGHVDRSSPKALGSKLRAGIPSAWKSSRHTAPAGTLLQPPAPAPAKRLSEPTISTFHGAEASSSPFRMDVDGASPQPRPITGSSTSSNVPILTGLFPSTRPLNHPRSVSDTRDARSPPPTDASGASDRIADFFLSDLSPIAFNPARARKRLLETENSPSPGCGALGDLTLGESKTTAVDDRSSPPRPPPPAFPQRRPFEKASSTNNLRQARRRGSTNALGSLNKRPALSSVASMGPPPAPANGDYKRHAQQLNGKPSTLKGVRRAYSVADATAPLQPLSPNFHSPHPMAGIVGNGDGMTKEFNFFSTMGRRAGTGVSASIDIGMMDPSTTMGAGVAATPETGSPLAGFRNQEERGKALPCFPVKEDGLMRIEPETLDLLQGGAFGAEVASYTIIDCRFSYEFEGGHIRDAVNMPTTIEVEQAFLEIPNLPAPSTSEKTVSGGKNILIFHCEFSAKRAPTSAKHLRSRDRCHNSHDYPNIYYPEVYVLQGGYAEYYKKFPARCVGGYLSMDDPSHNTKRSADLHAFRQQTRPFSRASSFTFGEAQSASALLKAATSRAPLLVPAASAKFGALAPPAFVFPSNKAGAGAAASGSITEEEHDGDSSFGSTNPGSSPCGAGDSPCPPTSKIGPHSLKIGKELGDRRPFIRAQTSSSVLFGFNGRR